MTHIFGSFAAPGLVHQNAYTESKLIAIYNHFNYKNIDIKRVEETDRGYAIQALIITGVK